MYISLHLQIFLFLAFKKCSLRESTGVRYSLMNSITCKKFFTCPTALLWVNTLPLAKATGMSQIFHLMVKCCSHMLTVSGKRFSTTNPHLPLCRNHPSKWRYITNVTVFWNTSDKHLLDDRSYNRSYKYIEYCSCLTMFEFNPVDNL